MQWNEQLASAFKTCYTHKAVSGREGLLHAVTVLDVATLCPAGKSCCWPQVVNRDELLNSLEDIATAFDMRVRPYSATSGQSVPLLTPLPTAVAAQTSRHPCLSPACSCTVYQFGPKHGSG